MSYIMSVLAGIIGVYIILIFLRILLTWFPSADFGKPYLFLCSICDPFLAWFRRFKLFKNSSIDFSPIFALAFLSLLQNIFRAWSAWGRISLAAVLVLLLGAVWSILSWVLGFFIVVLVLRMIAYLGNFNIYSPLWRFVDYIAQPVMYRISRIFFPSRIVNYLLRIIISIAALAALFAILRFAVGRGTLLLRLLPV
jgi:YggT family protein